MWTTHNEQQNKVRRRNADIIKQIHIARILEIISKIKALTTYIYIYIYIYIVTTGEISSIVFIAHGQHVHLESTN